MTTPRKHTRELLSRQMAYLQKQFHLSEYCRQTLQSKLEAVALHWFLEAGGTEEEFETKFNVK